MTPRRTYHNEPENDEFLNPFGDPRTIPTGWNVSAFYAPERENAARYASPQTPSNIATPTPYDHTKDIIS